MSRIEVEEKPGSDEKRVVFKKRKKSLSSKLYGTLKHDEKEVDKVVRAEIWDL